MSSGPALVSVIVPAFNAQAHLRETLDSVLHQTYSRLELIVVDDGSRDDTSAVAESVARLDSRVRVVRQQNAGVGAARNTGLQLARGRYLAPLDADDLWSPRKLECQVAALERAGPGVGMVYCWSRTVDRQNRLLLWGPQCRFEGWVGSVMLLGNFIGNASVPLVRTSAIAAIGGYLTRAQQDGAQGCEDWDFYLRIAEMFRLCCVPEYHVSYRQSDVCMSLNAQAMAHSYEVIMQRAKQRNPRLDEPLFQWSAARFYGYLLTKCYSWCDYPGALRCFARVLRTDPAAWINPRNFRLGALSLFHLLSHGRFRRHRAPPPLAAVADPRFEQSPPVLVPARGLFTQIQNHRLEIAMQTPGPRRRRALRDVTALGFPPRVASK